MLQGLTKCSNHVPKINLNNGTLKDIDFIVCTDNILLGK